MKRQARLDRMKAVEREFDVARLASRFFHQIVSRNPALLHGENLSPADARAFANNLEASYLIRLFAEFETGIRDLWTKKLKRKDQTRTYDIVQSLAAKYLIPNDDRDNVHAVREYRNTLVHEHSEESDPVDFRDARKYLCTYFSRLPLTW
jgi:hypothetical protein